MRITAIIFAGLLLGTVGITIVFAAPPSFLSPPHPLGSRDAALPTPSGSSPPVGIVVDTISTTSGKLTAGNVAGTPNQLGPNFLTYDPSAGKIFVSYDPYPDDSLGQGDAGGVAVINSSTGNVTGNIVDGIQPDDVLYDPNNGYVYAVDWRSSQVLVIDPTTDTVLTTIDTGDTSSPVAIALDPVNDHLFVTVSSSEVGAGVEVIDGSDNNIIDQLAAGLSPWWDVYDPANGELYVEDAGSNNVSVFNASTGATVTSINVTTGDGHGVRGTHRLCPFRWGPVRSHLRRRSRHRFGGHEHDDRDDTAAQCSGGLLGVRVRPRLRWWRDARDRVGREKLDGHQRDRPPHRGNHAPGRWERRRDHGSGLTGRRVCGGRRVPACTRGARTG